MFQLEYNSSSMYQKLLNKYYFESVLIENWSETHKNYLK